MATHNPYEAPQSDLELRPESTEPSPAYSNRRFFNAVIDGFAILFMALVIGIVGGIIGGDAFVDLMDKIPNLVFGMFLHLLYYLPFEATTGRTIGKYITGTKVVDADGLKPSVGQIVGRTFARFIPFEIFSFLGTYPRGWHDKLSGTYVVRVDQGD